jgi:hypothetical protein
MWMERNPEVQTKIKGEHFSQGPHVKRGAPSIINFFEAGCRPFMLRPPAVVVKGQLDCMESSYHSGVGIVSLVASFLS